MFERFQGTDGRRRLLEVVTNQPIASGDPMLAERLLAAGELRRFQSDDVLVSQGAAENSLFLLCAGQVSVRVNGREVARRGAGDHVGEMAILEPSAPRAATLVALDEVVALEIPEPAVLDLAEEFPAIWRSLARVLAGRLRQRGTLVQSKRETPRLFVGSSSEGRDIARGIQAGLDHDPILTTVWTDSVFPPSRQTLEALEAQLSLTDFALLVLSPDDVVQSRGKEATAPRDNVIFELGLFCGALGRGRTFMLMPRGVELKLPSDLFGLTALDYAPGDSSDLAARLGPVCTALRGAILNSGTR